MKLKIQVVMFVLFIFVIGIVGSVSITYLWNNQQIYDKYEEALESVCKLSYSYIDSKYPGDWSIQGNDLYKGKYNMSCNYESIDRIAKDTGVMATLFKGDTSVATSIVVDGKRMIDTKASKNVAHSVMQEGNIFQGIVKLGEEKIQSYYMPLKDGSGKRIGMYSTGIRKEGESNNLQRVGYFVCIMSLLSFIVALIYILHYYTKLENVVSAISTQLEHLGKKDFSHSLVKSATHMKGEMGKIANATERVKTILGTTIHTVVESVSEIDGAINETNDEVNQLNNRVNNVTAITQEMTASFEETAAATDEMAASCSNIIDSMEVVVRTIKTAMQQMEKLIEDSTQSRELMEITSYRLSKVLDDSSTRITKTIEEISAIDNVILLSNIMLSNKQQMNELMEQLLEILMQCTGECDREEKEKIVRTKNRLNDLLRSSNDNIEMIAQLLSQFNNTIRSMIESSIQLLNYMDKDIKTEFESLIQSGEKSHEVIQMFTTIFDQTVLQGMDAMDAIKRVGKSVEEIGTITNENVDAVTYIAGDMSEICTKSEIIHKSITELKKNSNMLKRFVKEVKTKQMTYDEGKGL